MLKIKDSLSDLVMSLGEGLVVISLGVGMTGLVSIATGQDKWVLDLIRFYGPLVSRVLS